MAPIKLEGYEFFNQTLKSPKMILAPMVDQSELAWRILSRRYGADVCVTPMFHAKLFSEVKKYRQEQFTTNTEDRPLIVQFCANDPDILLKAAQLVEEECDAVDINLGCPQHIAKRGHYGSYLQDEWELIAKMVNTLHTQLRIPVTVKIRCFPTVEKTVEYAQMIERAGAQMLTVHGRLREQKGHNTGVADWDKIKAVKEAVSIPVVANGNILYHEDIQTCMEYTGADAVMTAEGSLYNPAIFSTTIPYTYDIAMEYLDICEQVPTHPGMIKGHLFKILQPTLRHHTDLRARLGQVKTLVDYKNIVNELKERISKEIPEVEAEVKKEGIREYPYWRCQPYIRPAPTPTPTTLKREAPELEEKRTGKVVKIASDDTTVEVVKIDIVKDRVDDKLVVN